MSESVLAAYDLLLKCCSNKRSQLMNDAELANARDDEAAHERLANEITEAGRHLDNLDKFGTWLLKP